MHNENVAENHSISCQVTKFQSFYMKSTLLRKMVISDFALDVEIQPFLHMCLSNGANTNDL